MRHIYLLRHAKSSLGEAGTADFDRKLNGRGIKAARLVAGHLGQAAIRPALVLCSAARRTRETYAIVEPVLKGVPVSTEESLYLAGRHELLSRLRRLDDHLGSVLLIGHNPGLERLAESLCGGHGEAAALAELARKYPTGALACLECGIGHWAEIEAGSCRLTAFVRPRDLGGDED